MVSSNSFCESLPSNKLLDWSIPKTVPDKCKCESKIKISFRKGRKHWRGKGEYFVYQCFLLSQQCVLPYQKNRNNNFSDIEFVVCKRFEFDPVQKIVVW